MIVKNPVSAVRLPKSQSSERGVFSHDEIQKLLDAAPSLEWQTLILLGYFVGARLRDCVHMKWEHVNADEGVISYEQAKTGRKVVVPMHYHIIGHLKYLSQFGTEGYLCTNLASKGPGGKHGLSEGFKRIVRKAGIDLMTVEGKGIRRFSRRTFHSLRHSFSYANEPLPRSGNISHRRPQPGHDSWKRLSSGNSRWQCLTSRYAALLSHKDCPLKLNQSVHENWHVAKCCVTNLSCTHWRWRKVFT